MSKEAMKLALEALNVAEHFIEEYAASKYYFAHIAAKTSLEEALTKQEHGEPVAWISKGGLTELIHSAYTEVYAEQDAECLNTIPLYTTPQQRTWVGLTDDEIKDIFSKQRMIYNTDGVLFGKAIEAKLKEKNNA